MKEKIQNQDWKGNPNPPEVDADNMPLPLGADLIGSSDKSTRSVRKVDRNQVKKDKNPSGEKSKDESLSKRGESNLPDADVDHRPNPRPQFGQAGEKGIVLVLSLGLIAMFSILATGFVTMGVRNTQLGSNYRYSSEALSSAEAGIQFAIGQMNADNIKPPEPKLGEIEWENWVHSLETPGYGSHVTISYVKDLMLPYFDSETGEYMYGEDRYIRITSEGFGPRETKKEIEVITAQPPPEGFNFHFAWQFGGNANLRNPATFSGHSDSLPPVVLQANKPYFDTDEDGDFDDNIDRGWNVGFHDLKLEEIKLDDPHPDSSAFHPDVPYLHSAGNIHSNGDLIFGNNPRVNGSVTAKGDIWEYSPEDSFENKHSHYIRYGYTPRSQKEPNINIPTNHGYWHARSLKDSTIHIITIENYDDYDFSISAGAYTWNDSDPLPSGTYYFDDDVKMAGNPTGNASLVTDHTISLSGHPTEISNDNLMAYIAGGDIRTNGTGYIQGLLYTKSNIDVVSNICILGAVYVGGEGDVDKNPVIVFDTKLKRINLLAKPVPPTIISWQEIIQ
jgi:hypothetical protein